MNKFKYRVGNIVMRTNGSVYPQKNLWKPLRITKLTMLGGNRELNLYDLSDGYNEHEKNLIKVDIKTYLKLCNLK